MSILSRFKEYLTPKTVYVYQSELSKGPKATRKVPKTFKNNSTRAITRNILETHEEARDDKELFISIVQHIGDETFTFKRLEDFSRSWRYIQQYFPELRGKDWGKRHRIAKEVAKTF